MTTAGAEVFGFPYASGGVAKLLDTANQLIQFSLRKWGCCQYDVFYHEFGHVFPTQVGVLPHAKWLHGYESSFPYASGGVAD